jgi:hypothetical protein
MVQRVARHPGERYGARFNRFKALTVNRPLTTSLENAAIPGLAPADPTFAMVDHFPPLGFGSFPTSTQLMRDSALLRATTELFLQEETHTPDEVNRFEELTAHLVPKVADQDRVFLAERLAARSDAPHAIVRMLARDRIAIAGPVLRASPVLGAFDLLSIIAATGVEHHRVIGERRGLTPEVRQALRISADRTLAAPVDEIEASKRMQAGAARRPVAIGLVPAGGEEHPAAAPGVDEAAGISLDATPAAGRDEPAVGSLERPAVRTMPGPGGRSPAGADRPVEDYPPLTVHAWAPRQEPGAVRAASRLDPFDFVRLDRPARLRLMADLATRPPIRRYGGPGGRIDRAFRAILSAAQIVALARRGAYQALIEAVAASLDVETDFVKACLDDATGEPFAVLLKSLGLDNVQAQQVFLLATPRIGRDVTTFFQICDLYAGMEPSVAEILTDAWRESRMEKAPRHVPHLAENGHFPRPGTGDPTHAPASAADEQRRRFRSGDKA